MRAHRDLRLSRRETLLLLAAILGVSLHVPLLSTAVATVVVALLAAASATGRAPASRAFRARLTVLSAFLVAFYGASVAYEYIGPLDGAKAAVYAVAFYWAGYVLTKKYRAADAPPSAVVVLSLPAIGVGAFAAVTTAGAAWTAGSLEVASRLAQNLWASGETVNAPGLGAMASLGMCLLPTVLLAKPLRGRGVAGRWWPAVLILGAAACAGVLVNISLQNRSPFVALAAAAFVTASIVIRTARTHGAKFVQIGGALVAASAVVWWAQSSSIASEAGIYQRFAQERLETERYDAWITVVSHAWELAAGGRVVPIGLRYAHNLWLDVLWDAGLLPLALLVIFQSLHVRQIRFVFCKGTPLQTSVLFGLLSAIGVTFLVEPALAISPIYFGATLYVLGSVLALSEGAAARTNGDDVSPGKVPGAFSNGQRVV